jgi:hypothetical protein
MLRAQHLDHNRYFTMSIQHAFVMWVLLFLKFKAQSTWDFGMGLDALA